MTLPVQLQLLQPSDVDDFDYSGIDAVISDDAGVLCTGSPTADAPITFPYQAAGVEFTGNHYLKRSGDLIGNSDGKQGLVSGWFRVDDISGSRYLFSNNSRFSILQTPGALFNITITDTLNVLQVNLTSTSQFFVTGTWHHYLCSWDVSTGAGKLYIDDVDETNGTVNVSALDLDYTNTTSFVGAKADGTGRWNGCLADLYINQDVYLDLDVVSNRRKFIGSSGGPVNLGSSGQLPTGTAPIVFMSGTTVTFPNNLGTGGGYIPTSGPLAVCSDLPGEDIPQTDSGAAYAYDLLGGIYANEQKLTASDIASGAKFGHLTYVSGDGATIFVAAHEVDGFIGAIYAFRRVLGVWVEYQKITIPGLVAGDKFSFSMACSFDGKTLAASAPFTNSGGIDRGEGYILEDNGTSFTLSATITASDAFDNNNLGYTAYIAKDGNTAFFGATGVSTTGAVYVVKKGSGWADGNEDQKIEASDGTTFDEFGAAVNDFFVFGGTPITGSFDGSTLLVGAYGWEGVSGSNTGAIYYFRLNTGTGLFEEIQIISNLSVTQNFHWLAYTLSCNNDASKLLVGAQSDDIGGFNVGRTFILVFNGSIYVEQQSFQPDVLSVNSFWGYRVFLDGEGRFAVVTASDYDGSGEDQGGTWLFDLAPATEGVIADHTLEEQAQSLANYLPGGQLFMVKNKSGTNLRNFLNGLAQEIFVTAGKIREYNNQILPDETTLFIDEWESAVGIPDDCFTGVGTIDDRRTNVLVKLASLGVQTEQEFIDLAALFGINVTVSPAVDHATFPFKFPMLLLDGDISRFSILITFEVTIFNSFPQTFPIVFGDPTIGLLQCLFTKLKPANVELIFVEV